MDRHAPSPPDARAHVANALARSDSRAVPRLLGWPLLVVGWVPWWWVALFPPASIHHAALLWMGVAGYPVWWGVNYVMSQLVESNWPTYRRVPLILDPGGVKYVRPAAALRFIRPFYAIMAVFGALMGWLVLLGAFFGSGDRAPDGGR